MVTLPGRSPRPRAERGACGCPAIPGGVRAFRRVTAHSRCASASMAARNSRTSESSWRSGASPDWDAGAGVLAFSWPQSAKILRSTKMVAVMAVAGSARISGFFTHPPADMRIVVKSRKWGRTTCPNVELSFQSLYRLRSTGKKGRRSQFVVAGIAEPCGARPGNVMRKTV